MPSKRFGEVGGRERQGDVDRSDTTSCSRRDDRRPVRCRSGSAPGTRWPCPRRAPVADATVSALAIEHEDAVGRGRIAVARRRPAGRSHAGSAQGPSKSPTTTPWVVTGAGDRRRCAGALDGRDGRDGSAAARRRDREGRELAHDRRPPCRVGSMAPTSEIGRPPRAIVSWQLSPAWNVGVAVHREARRPARRRQRVAAAGRARQHRSTTGRTSPVRRTSERDRRARHVAAPPQARWSRSPPARRRRRSALRARRVRRSCSVREPRPTRSQGRTRRRASSVAAQTVPAAQRVVGGARQPRSPLAARVDAILADRVDDRRPPLQLPQRRRR